LARCSFRVGGYPLAVILECESDVTRLPNDRRCCFPREHHECRTSESGDPAMSEPHDPNITVENPSASADSVRQADRTTIDQAPASASTDGSHPVVDSPKGEIPEIPGYRVLREIARGGMGRVLAAHDLALDRDVALKILLPGAAADRFVRESKITARL